jgi:hypothetical protein
VPGYGTRGAVQSPFASPSPRSWRSRAKAPQNHNPRVGGSSPSSGIRFTRPDPRSRAKSARDRQRPAGPQQTPTNALWADSCVPPRVPRGEFRWGRPRRSMRMQERQALRSRAGGRSQLVRSDRLLGPGRDASCSANPSVGAARGSTPAQTLIARPAKTAVAAPSSRRRRGATAAVPPRLGVNATDSTPHSRSWREAARGVRFVEVIRRDFFQGRADRPLRQRRGGSRRGRLRVGRPRSSSAAATARTRPDRPRSRRPDPPGSRAGR